MPYTARFKFNDGNGAVLCGRCSKIMQAPANPGDELKHPGTCDFCSNIPPKMEN